MRSYLTFRRSKVPDEVVAALPRTLRPRVPRISIVDRVYADSHQVGYLIRATQRQPGRSSHSVTVAIPDLTLPHPPRPLRVTRSTLLDGSGRRQRGVGGWASREFDEAYTLSAADELDAKLVLTGDVQRFLLTAGVDEFAVVPDGLVLADVASKRQPPERDGDLVWSALTLRGMLN